MPNIAEMKKMGDEEASRWCNLLHAQKAMQVMVNDLTKLAQSEHLDSATAAAISDLAAGFLHQMYKFHRWHKILCSHEVACAEAKSKENEDGDKKNNFSPRKPNHVGDTWCEHWKTGMMIGSVCEQCCNRGEYWDNTGCYEKGKRK